MITIIKTLLAIDLYEFSANDIQELRKKTGVVSGSIERYLPEYTIDKNGYIVSAYDRHQWTGNGLEKYLLFDLSTIDKLLGEEISNIGIDEILKEINLKPYLIKLKPKSADDYRWHMSASEYLIIKHTYSGGDYYNDDWDVEFEIEDVLTL